MLHTLNQMEVYTAAVGINQFDEHIVKGNKNFPLSFYDADISARWREDIDNLADLTAGGLVNGGKTNKVPYEILAIIQGDILPAHIYNSVLQLLGRFHICYAFKGSYDKLTVYSAYLHWIFDTVNEKRFVIEK